MSAFIIGLTGGIGSGKTTVTNIFAQHDIDIIDADLVARQVVLPGSEALQAIEAYFGSDYIDNKKQLDRTKLRTRIFSYPEDKLWLNNLLHPLIRQEIITQLNNSKTPYCILVAPLLLENGLQALVNRVLVVDIDENTQIQRTTSRDPSSTEEVNKIIASQIPRSKRLSFANDIIDNQVATLKTLQRQVSQLDKRYRELAQNQA